MTAHTHGEQADDLVAVLTRAADELRLLAQEGDPFFAPRRIADTHKVEELLRRVQAYREGSMGLFGNAVGPGSSLLSFCLHRAPTPTETQTP